MSRQQQHAKAVIREIFGPVNLEVPYVFGDGQETWRERIHACSRCGKSGSSTNMRHARLEGERVKVCRRCYATIGAARTPG